MKKEEMLTYKDVSDYEVIGPEGSGTAEAYWLQGEGSIFLWKAENEDFIINEVLASRLAKEIGIESAHCEFSQRFGQIGVLSQHVNETYDCAIVGLLDYYPEFNIIQDSGYSAGSFLDLIKTERKLTYDRVLNMLLFDYLIGNADRHYGNIGINKVTGDIAPLYDNAAGFMFTDTSRPWILYEDEDFRLQEEMIPWYLKEEFGRYYDIVADNFVSSAKKVDAYELLRPFKDVMSRLKYEHYEEKLHDQLIDRIRHIDILINQTI